MRCIKLLLLSGLSLLLLSCSVKDARYYRLHPMALQNELKNCPETHPKQISCQELAEIAVEVNQLAYQLQRDPQGFGNEILSAQKKLSQQEVAWAKDNNQLDLHRQIQQQKQKIAEYLAIVRWLESPEK